MTKFFLFAPIAFVLSAYSILAAPSPPSPSASERCAVCGMFVGRHPSWVAAIEYSGGKTEYFDGPKDMFKRIFSLKPESFTPFATDYYTLELKPAKDAWFVLGGDITGPMGKDLIPVFSEKNAKTFKRDHGASNILRYQEVNETLLGTLE